MIESKAGRLGSEPRGSPLIPDVVPSTTWSMAALPAARVLALELGERNIEIQMYLLCVDLPTQVQPGLRSRSNATLDAIPAVND